MEDKQMPVGAPNSQTIASKKYHEKVGIKSKSYKLKTSVTDAFAAKCQEKGESQASVVTRLMNMYINDEI